MDDTDYAVLPVEQWRAVIRSRLVELGLSHSELAQYAKQNTFPSTGARTLWAMIGRRKAFDPGE